MEIGLIALILTIVLFALLAAGVWVSIALICVALTAMVLGSPVSPGDVLVTTIWGASNSYELASLPMFIWMGEILFRNKLSEAMFAGLAPWLGRLPGRLLHVNIWGCGIFAAVSGSSSATTATIGKMTLPELAKRNYDEKLSIGTLAGSGTLGLLIPPSIILIVYGAATDQSIARLFIAGIAPGLLLLLLFTSYVVIQSKIKKVKSESLVNTELTVAEEYTFKEKVAALNKLLPIVFLIGGLIGSIYVGIASPTEAAAVGVILSLFITKIKGTLSTQSFIESIMAATSTSCMIIFILAGAAFLTSAMGFTGIPRELANWIGQLQLSPVVLLGVLTVFFIILGCFLDGISVVVLTTSIILPIIESVGINPIWFGIYLVVVVEMSQITPPVGFNLFVIQSLTDKNILTIAGYAFPFFLLMLFAVVLMCIFPQIVLWLPDQMNNY
ncbi:TRAP transporter large permease [Spartinivicinus poritis]|uniref:TRAP transporter large permease protein n=1 Tax=Spartinivicinus poritis TaxID=2994640 RepID=A0ABT5UG59_9GAMM|nr:TRAP transporter large permease subunit [Spartinivicinus sp. A2-2]MDE1465366.1 TRAP transporter large permease subunit [Spartinivicinus sp. A2-2]